MSQIAVGYIHIAPGQFGGASAASCGLSGEGKVGGWCHIGNVARRHKTSFRMKSLWEERNGGGRESVQLRLPMEP